MTITRLKRQNSCTLPRFATVSSSVYTNRLRQWSAPLELDKIRRQF
jgi:hypothetical protein